MRVVVPQRQVPLTGDGTLLPECLHRLVVDRRAKGDEQDAGEFTVVEAVIQRLETIDLLPHSLRDGAGPLPVYHLNISGKESSHALLPEAALEGADGVRMGMGFLRPLLGRPIGKQDQRADHLIAPLGLIHEAQLQLCKLRSRFHRCPSPVVGLRGLCSILDRGCHPGREHLRRLAWFMPPNKVGFIPHGCKGCCGELWVVGGRDVRRRDDGLTLSSP
jgi:hypothetical protein